MPNVFVYSGATQSMLDCEQDDPSVRGMDLSHFASPSLTGVASSQTLALLKAREALVGDFEWEMDDGEFVPDDIEWSTEQARSNDGRDSCTLLAVHDGETVGIAVVQELPLD